MRVEGYRHSAIAPLEVQKLMQKLQDEDFFHWKETKYVCVDYPDVIITVTLNGQHKRVREGCNIPGAVLKLAGDIDRISGATRWVGKPRL